jgi:uncharacterized protein
MKMSGEEIIHAPRDAVWKALNDEKVLKACIPGCDQIIRHSPTELEAKVTIKLGPVKAQFGGDVTLSNIDPPNGYRISGKGNGVAGMASGGADVRLADVPDGTKLSYDVDAQVGGKLAMLGARLIDSTASQLAAQFFEKFAAAATALAKAAPIKKSAVKRPAAKKPMVKKPVKKIAKKPVKKVAKKKR